jgi:hypothetical protein
MKLLGLDSMVIGYHCTRLLKHEIEDINKNGLALPSTTFLSKKLQAAGEFGYFNQEEIQQLIAHNSYLEMPGRENLLYFVCGYSALKDGGGIYKFFRCWGGEAIFNSYQNQLPLFLKLCLIGIPCIIKAKFKQKSGVNLAESLESTFLYNRNMIECLEAGYEVVLSTPLLREHIIKIIHSDDPNFKKLTAYHEWEDRYTLLTN